MVAGLASPQASPSGANNRLDDGEPSHQPTSGQQTPSNEPQSTQPPSSQPESSFPALAQKENGDTEQQEGADLQAGSGFRDPGSAQDKSAQGRALPGQAVSSEELTSSEEGLQRQQGLLQSVEGSRGVDKGTEAGKASNSSSMSTSVEQDAGSGEEESTASSRGQNVDEVEDTTTRMLEFAGELSSIWSSQCAQATD